MDNNLNKIEQNTHTSLKATNDIPLGVGGGVASSSIDRLLPG